MRKKYIPSDLFFGFFLFIGLLALSANAATRTVDTTADDSTLTACTAAANDCSLRGAITNAAAGYTVNFDPSLTNATITLGGTIDIVRNVSIIGPGADKLTISGGGTTKLFNYFGGSTLTINFSNLTIASGNGAGGHNNNQGGAMEINGGATILVFDSVYFRNNSASAAGGVLVFFGGECRITNSTFFSNSSPLGSVIYFIGGTLRVTNSTFSGNSGGNFGAISLNNRPAIIRNSTIVNNTGGGIYKLGNSLTLGNTIVAGNSGFDLFSSGPAVTTSGGNLIGNNTNVGATFAAGMPNANNDYVGTAGSPVSPQLAPLANNGGPTPTHALLTGSPAINAGNNCVLTTGGCGASDPIAGLTTDQRGAPRAVGGTTDIGAFERNITFTPTTLPNGNRNIPYSQTLTVDRSAGMNDFGDFGDWKQILINPLTPFNFTLIPIAGENLPPGLSLAAGGQISGTPTITGSYTFTVQATDTDGMAGVQKYTVQILSPTAAHVSVSGRVLTPDGRGLQSAIVTMTGQSGNVRTVRSSSFGNFSFADVPAGEIYVFEVVSKKYQFAPQVMSVSEDITELILTANE